MAARLLAQKMLSVQVAAYPKNVRSWPEYSARELFNAGGAPFIRTMIRIIYEIILLWAKEA